jgi:hypothetical protein
MSAAFSASIIVGPFKFPLTIAGMMDASTTLKPMLDTFLK